MNIEEAKSLSVGQIIYQLYDGKVYRWRVNGKVKTWVRNPNRVRVPLKHGMYVYGYLNQDNLEFFHLSNPLQ